MSQPTTSEPNSKRKRTNENKVVNIVTRSTIWFDDGNIILQAETTQFRVHKSVLSRNSSFFRGMFTVPQPESEPTIEGCAIVHVADAEKDWTNILEILYDNLRACNSTDLVSLSMLEAMLRLGRKYEFDHFKEEALQRLNVDLPKTLDLWDKTYGDGYEKRDLNYHIFDLINLLLELGIQSVLPVAYYVCLDDFPLGEIVLGSKYKKDKLVHLSPTAKAALISGYEALAENISVSLEWVKWENLKSCHSTGTCNAERAELMREVIKKWHSFLLYSPRGWQFLYSPPTPLCAVCIAKMQERIQDTREQIWEKLPTYFNLPNWNDLTDD